MARFITFNGVTLYHPGALSKVDATNMAQVGHGVSGVVGVVGEADGGQPNKVSDVNDDNYGKSKVYEFTDPDAAINTFKGGELAEAVNFLFNPGNDVRIAGGAQKIIAIKTNQGTRSSRSFRTQPGVAESNALEIKSVDYGEYTEQIAVEILENATDSTKVDVVINDQFSTIRETLTKAAGSCLVNIQYKGPDSPAVVVSGITTVASTVGHISGMADTSDVKVGNFIRIVADNGLAGQDVLVGQTRRIGSITPNSAVAVHGTWSDASNDALIPGIGTQYEVIRAAIGPFKVTATDTSTIVVNGTHDTSGMNSFRAGGNTADAFGTGAGPSYMRVLSGTGSGQIRRIQSADEDGVTGIVTLSLADALVTGLDSTSRIMLVNAGYDITGIMKPYGALATIEGTKGSANKLRLSVAAGWGEPGSGVTSITDAENNLTYAPQYEFDLSSSISVSQLIHRVNTGGTLTTGFSQPSGYVTAQDHGWSMKLGAGRSSSLTTDRFDFVDAEVPISAEATKRQTSDTTNLNVNALVDFNTVFSNTWGEYTGSGASVKNYRLLDSLQQLIDTINNQSGICSASRASTQTNDGCGMVDFTGVSESLTGGVKGETTGVNIADAFEELLKHRHTTAVALWSDDTTPGTLPALHELLKSHANSGAGGYKNEMDCIAGFDPPNATALASISNTVEDLNNRNIGLVYQKVQRRSITGGVKVFKPHMLACIIAGMQSGAQIGEPLTFKYINALDIVNPVNADSSDKSVSDFLLQSGVLFCERVQGRGFRVVRNMSTYTKDDNLAYVDRHINYELNYMAYDMRTDLENRFTGLKSSAATVSSLKGAVISKLEYYRNTINIITDSNDSVTGAVINAYRNLKVTISGDIATIRFEVFPTTGINYLTFEIFAQLPTIIG